MSVPEPTDPREHDDRHPAATTDRAAMRHLELARRHAREAEDASSGGLGAWIDCAHHAYEALAARDDRILAAGIVLATNAAAEIIARLLREHPGEWPSDPVRLDGFEFHVEFHGASTPPRAPWRMRRARDIPMDAFDGRRYFRSGLGLPMAVLSTRGMELMPDRLSLRSGAFRNLTAWIGPADTGAGKSVRLVLADPQLADRITVGARLIPLASDTSAAYAWAMQLSKLRLSGMWSLLGDREVTRRAGLYQLEEYDPAKRPLVMIHGLGSQPLIWAHLSNAIWGAEDLRSRFQIWQVLYETDAPVLATRLRVQQYLDEAWRNIDPTGAGRANAGAVLIGHSLGGVIARLLCADSGSTLWDTAFTRPSASLRGEGADRDTVEHLLRFHPYPGVVRAVFLAAPHRGAPAAEAFLGRVAGDLLGGRASEVHALHRVARANREAIRAELSDALSQESISSITTLRPNHPMRKAIESLMPAAGIPYHTIAAVLPYLRMQTDGVVPLESALLDGAASSLVVESSHGLHGKHQVVEEVLRILRL